MKESYAFKLAQYSVLRDENLKEHEKLAILRVLIEREDLALFTEERERKDGENP